MTELQKAELGEILADLWRATDKLGSFASRVRTEVATCGFPIYRDEVTPIREARNCVVRAANLPAHLMQEDAKPAEIWNGVANQETKG